MMVDLPSDEDWMQLALAQAKAAAVADEVPVGAVLVSQDGSLLASGHNSPIGRSDPTAHAEIVVLREGALRLRNYRLLGATLYVSLEPCTMCVGAILQARIARVVFAAFDPKFGACGSALQALQYPGVTHYLSYTGGLLAEQSAALLKEFFKERRGK